MTGLPVDAAARGLEPLCAPPPPPPGTTAPPPGSAAADIYAPIRDHMARLEGELDRVIRDAPPFLKDELTHALKGGGKRLRPALVLLAGSFYPGRPGPLTSMALAYELLHTATLVHDDTIDRAVTRRGMLTVNRLWGDSNAVRLGDYLCGCSAMMAARTDSLRAMGIFSRALADLCGGAAAEHTAGCGWDREEYFTTIRRKTASLFSAATESGAVLSGAPAKAVRAATAYGHYLGMAFQTLDDIQDYRGDLARRAITLPGILLLEQPENRRVADLLETDAPAALDALVEMVTGSGVLDRCRQIAQGFCAGACSSLQGLPAGPVRDSLRRLVDYIVERAG